MPAPAPASSAPLLARALAEDRSSEAAQLEAAAQLRCLLAAGRFDCAASPAAVDAAAALVPRLAGLLKRDARPRLQLEAAAALASVAGGALGAQAAVEAGAAPRLVRLLDLSDDEAVREQAAWALGTFAGSDAGSRDAVLAAGALPPLLRRLVAARSLSFIRCGAWVLAKLCARRPAPRLTEVRGALPTLAALLRAPDATVLANALDAVASIANGDADGGGGGGNIGGGGRLAAVRTDVDLARVVELLSHEDAVVRSAALSVVSSFVDDGRNGAQIAVDAGALPHLRVLLRDKSPAAREKACLAISRIAAGPEPQVQALLDAGVPQLLATADDLGAGLSRAACWTLASAATGGSCKQVAELVRQGAIRALVAAISAEDGGVVAAGLEGADGVLRHSTCCGGRATRYRAAFEEAGAPAALARLGCGVYKAWLVSRRYFGLDTAGEVAGVAGADGAVAPAGAAAFPSLDQLPQMTHTLLYGGVEEKLEASTQIRRLLSVSEFPPQPHHGRATRRSNGAFSRTPPPISSLPLSLSPSPRPASQRSRRQSTRSSAPASCRSLRSCW